MPIEGIVDNSVHNLFTPDTKVKKIYVVERDDNALGYFLSQEESVEYLRRVVTQEYISLLPTNNLRVVEETENGAVIVRMYATLRDTFMLVERLHTKVVSRETFTI